MKQIIALFFALGLSNIASAQYAHPRPNDTGITTTETKDGVSQIKRIVVE